MANSDKRLRYYTGQFLKDKDFTDEQSYHLDRQRQHNRQLHTSGIADGLTVTANLGEGSVTVSPGTAIDGEGRMIVLAESRTVHFGSLTGSVLVVISYGEQTSDPASAGDVEDSRYWERPDVEVIAEAGAPAPDLSIRLARLRLDGGKLAVPQDTSVRTAAGVKLGTEVAIERILLSRQGVASGLWPVLSSEAPSQADLAGNISVTGNVLVSGTVDGRDISVDGANLDLHTSSTSNPHGTTAAQVGAITGVAGVVNPGGQVDLVPGNNIRITPDSAGHRITIASSTIKGISNPGGNIDLSGVSGITVTPDVTTNTIKLAGAAPTSISGVSSPGGNIDLVGSGGIAITPDSTDKRITIAMPNSAILRHALTSVSLDQLPADSYQFDVVVGFQPQFISMEGTFEAGSRSDADADGRVRDSYLGGALGGFCHIDDSGTLSVSGHGPIITRSVSFPYVRFVNRFVDNSLCFMSFTDESLTPVKSMTLRVQVIAIASAGFTLVIDNESITDELSFNLSLCFAVFG